MSQGELFARLLRQARRYWPRLMAASALSVAAAPLSLLLPVPLKLVVDSVINSRPLPQWAGALLPDSWSSTKMGVALGATGLLVIVNLAIQLQSIGTWLLNTHTGERLVEHRPGTLGQRIVGRRFGWKRLTVILRPGHDLRFDLASGLISRRRG